MENVYEVPVFATPSILVARKNIQGYVSLDAPGGPEVESSFRKIWLSS